MRSYLVDECLGQIMLVRLQVGICFQLSNKFVKKICARNLGWNSVACHGWLIECS